MTINTESYQRANSHLLLVKRVIVLAFIPLPSIAIGVNNRGVTNKISSIPGINKEGGLTSGISALVIVVMAICLAFGMAVIASSTGLPFLGDDSDSEIDTPTSSPTPTPGQTPTAVSSATPTPESTPTQTPTLREQNPELARFEQALRDRMSNHDPNLVQAPVLATQFKKGQNGTVDIWVIFDEIEAGNSEEAEDMRTQWSNVAIWYANTVGNHEGSEPDRLVAVGLNEKFNNTHYTISTEEAQAAYDGDMNKTEYTNLWWNRMSGHDEDSNVSQYARQLVAEEGMRTPTDSRDE